MSRRARRALLLCGAAVVLLCSCDSLASFHSADSSAASRDGPIDHPPPVDIDPRPQDKPVADVSVDANGNDLTADASPRDSGGEPALDLVPAQEASRPDMTVDSIALISGCSAGSTSIMAWGTDMVLCKTGGGLVIQDDSSKLCDISKGWTTCPASLYKLRSALGGTHPQRGWIRGCVRHSGAPFAPVDAFCAVNALSLGQVPITWPCGGGSPTGQSDTSSVSLVTNTSCQRVGIDDASTEANWTTGAPGDTLPATVCCR